MAGDTEDSSILFLTCVAGPKHETLEELIAVDIEKWIRSHAVPIRLVDHGGQGHQLGIQYRPRVGDKVDPDHHHARLVGDPNSARVVMEADYTHQDSTELKLLGFVALANPYTRVFLAVKIWKKNIARDFAAAVVVWGKDDGIVVRQAVDIGTKPMNRSGKAMFETRGDVLPPVTEWTRLLPSPGYDSLRSEFDSIPLKQIKSLPMNDNWSLKLPAADFLYKASSEECNDDAPYFLDENPSIPDCIINLHSFAWKIHLEDFS
jgi:hypothetical protein